MEDISEIIQFREPLIECQNISSQQWQEYSSILKQRTQFYREENARMESTFKNLKIMNEDLKLPGLQKILEDFSNISEQFCTKDVTTNSLLLSQSNQQQKHNDHLLKLKISIRHYQTLNENLSKEIEFIKGELDHCKIKLDDTLKLSPQEINQIEEKAKKYETELIKLENRYTWLKDPEINLPHIAKEIENLQSLKEEKEKLVKELEQYQNLKPDIKEAKQQLASLKAQIKMFNKDV